MMKKFPGEGNVSILEGAPRRTRADRRRKTTAAHRRREVAAHVVSCAINRAIRETNGKPHTQPGFAELADKARNVRRRARLPQWLSAEK
jgi:hypothetical protein